MKKPQKKYLKLCQNNFHYKIKHFYDFILRQYLEL